MSDYTEWDRENIEWNSGTDIEQEAGQIIADRLVPDTFVGAASTLRGDNASALVNINEATGEARPIEMTIQSLAEQAGISVAEAREMATVDVSELSGEADPEPLPDIIVRPEGTPDELVSALDIIRNPKRSDDWYETVAEGDPVVYLDSEDPESDGGTTIEFGEQRDQGRFFSRLEELRDGELSRERFLDSITFGERETSPELQRRRERREITDAAREAARKAGIDLDEFDVAAAYNEDKVTGEIVIQDKDTGRTRRIDPDTSRGLGDALDAETSGGEFVADDADPAASGSDADDGLGARAAGAIVLLFGAIAAALGWLP